MEPSFKVICATRASRDGFATQTALGRSLALFPHPFIELELHAGNRTGLATLYNAAIDRCRSHPAYLVFAHDDVHLLDLFDSGERGRPQAGVGCELVLACAWTELVLAAWMELVLDWSCCW